MTLFAWMYVTCRLLRWPSADDSTQFRPEECDRKSQNGDKLKMHYTVRCPLLPTL